MPHIVRLRTKTGPRLEHRKGWTRGWILCDFLKFTRFWIGTFSHFDAERPAHIQVIENATLQVRGGCTIPASAVPECGRVSGSEPAEQHPEVLDDTRYTG
jgi:hypothetical protein